MIDLKDMLKAGLHFGHKTSFWHPKMRPYIWGAKNKIHLIDISKTAFLLEHTAKKLKDLAASGKSILWIGTKKSAQGVIAKIAKQHKMPYVINRWIGGTLSNYDQIKKAITRLLHLQDVLKKQTSNYTKKERVMLQKEVDRLEKNIGGIIDLDYPPAAIVVVDAKKEHSAIREAIRMHVPIIAMIDTNTNPEGIDYLIPANDDSPRSIEFVMGYLAKAAVDGKKIADDAKAKEEADRRAEIAKSRAAHARPALPRKAHPARPELVHHAKSAPARPAPHKTAPAKVVAKPAPQKETAPAKPAAPKAATKTVEKKEAKEAPNPTSPKATKDAPRKVATKASKDAPRKTTKK